MADENKFVIHNKENDTYWLAGSPRRWVSEVFGASKFKSTEAAAKEINTIPNCDLTQTEVVSFGLAGRQVHEVCLADMNNARDLTQEEADMTFSVLHDCITAFEDVDSMLLFYSEAQKRYDGMQQDLLHRIELGPIVGLTGLRLVKQLKEVRQMRREAKDKIAYLLTVKSTPIRKLATTMKNFDDKIANRTYTPRQMPELFNEKERCE